MKLDPSRSHFTGISTKWIKSIKVRPETLKMLQLKNRKNTVTNRHR
jgi:hypothetical protein